MNKKEVEDFCQVYIKGKEIEIITERNNYYNISKEDLFFTDNGLFFNVPKGCDDYWLVYCNYSDIKELISTNGKNDKFWGKEKAK